METLIYITAYLLTGAIIIGVVFAMNNEKKSNKTSEYLAGMLIWPLLVLMFIAIVTNKLTALLLRKMGC